MTEYIQCNRDGALLEVVLHRPERKNALNNAMYLALTDALTAADTDPSVRCILLRGAPGAFCAGNDVKEFISAPPLAEDAPVFQMLRALSTNTKILAAAVDGLAVGIGVTMLLHFDLVLASRGATFQLPFINLGIVPEAASTLLLPRLIGHQRSMELLLLGDPVSADQSCAYGLVNQVLEADALLPTARQLIARILAKPPGALLRIKQLVKSETASVQDRMRQENAALAVQIVSPEGKEAITALIEKRPPNFAL